MSQEAQLDRALAGLTRGLSRFVLDNGLVVLVREDPSDPMASAQVWLGTGSADEQDYLGGGLSHWMEHMIFKGTPARPPGAIARAIHDRGGYINAYTTLDRTVFLAEVPAPDWRLALEVLADALANASFPEDEWAREKEVIRREMAMDQDSPDRRLSRLLFETAYRAHPYRAPVIGYPDVFAALSRQDLLAFFRRHYAPDNLILVLAGNVRAAEAAAAIRELFGPWPRRARPPVTRPAEPDQAAARTARGTGPYAVTRAAVCWHTVAFGHPDAPELDLLAAAAGQGDSSRLVLGIRDRLKLAHEISAWSFTPRDPGLFGISAVCDPDRESALLDAIFREAEGWTRAPLPAPELDKARRAMLVGVLASFQTARGQAGHFASGEFYAGAPAFFLDYLRRLESATPESVLAVARKYLRPENRTTAVLAPESAAAPSPPAAAAGAAGRVEKLTLSNGIPLLVREDRRLPMVWISAVGGGGLLLESESNNGITRLMADLMPRGAGGRSAEEIARAVESLGAALEPHAGRNSFGLSAQGLSRDVEALVDIVADCLLAPAFDPGELARRKPIQSALIRQQRESPMFIAQEALRQALFPGHPYRLNPEGALPAVEAVTADDLRRWHADLVVGSNIVLAIFGDLSPDQARALAERHFLKTPAGPRPRPVCPASRPELPRRLRQAEPREQAVFLAGFPGTDLLDPRNDALEVLQQTLTGMSSDLFASIREQRGLAYYAGAIHQPGVSPGLFAVYVGTRTSALEQVETLVREEIARLTARGIRPEEFERARRKLATEQAQRLQLNGDLALECALNELYGRGAGYSFETADRLNRLTPEAVREAAAALLQTNRMAISVVVPEKDAAEPKAP